jgi:tetratricopeptide (TPR) repeat protein
MITRYYRQVKLGSTGGWSTIRRVLIPCLVVLLAFSYGYCESALEKGLKEFKNENLEEALVLLLEAKKADPGNATVAYYLGLTYKGMEDLPKAIPYFRDALTLTPPVKDALVELVDALYLENQLAETRQWIDRGEKEGIQPARLQFLKGLVLMKEGKNQEAAAAFRKSKELNKQMSQAAEFKIADSYLQEGKLKESKDFFIASSLIDPSTSIGGFAKEYERIVADKVTQERPWSFWVGLYYKYDSNVVAKPSSGPFADYVSGQKDALLSTAVNVSYVAPFSFSTPWTLSVLYALTADRYFRRDDYNNMTQLVSVTPGYTFPRLSVAAPVFYSYYWLQLDKGTDFTNSPGGWITDTKYSRLWGTNPSVRYLITDNHVAEVSFRYMKKDYVIPVYDPTEDRDGDNYAASIGWIYLFKEGKATLSLRFTRAREKTDGRNWSYDQDEFALGLSYPLSVRLRFQVSGEAAFSRYEHTNTVFGMKRRNDTYNGLAALYYNLWDGMSMVAQYAYTRDNCNISLYGYKRSVGGIGLEYRY